MPLGTEVDIGLGHIVLDGDPAPPSERAATYIVHVEIFRKRCKTETTDLLLQFANRK